MGNLRNRGILASWLALICSGGLLAMWLSPQKSERAATPPSPLSPEEALRQFQLDPGLRMELVACEPQIESPVAMTFDEEGQLWVVEMLDYPNGPGKGQPGQGRIKVLRDREGDGRYEQATVFADQLLFANGLLLWQGGVIVTAAPHILYLKDTDGDGKADVRQILYEGFSQENPQLRVSHPILGADGWIYVANGLRGGKVRAAGKPDAKVVDLSGGDFRFHPRTGAYEAVTGMGQYGNCFDAWGQRFVCDNRHHLRHVVLERRYVQRNPFLAVGELVADTSELDEGPLFSGGKIYPLSKNWTTSNLHGGRFTAACGVFVYRGGLLPQRYQGNAFTCDPTGNLVHGEILTAQGSSFSSRPLHKDREFLATRDDWFRPVFLADGPEGALYVVDMYRAVIEHPEFMPPELKQRPDLMQGKERGRIWRIVPTEHKTQPLRPAMARTKPDALLEALSSPLPWIRQTASRRLWEQLEDVPSARLRELCRAGTSPEASLHAAWLLHGKNDLDQPTLLALLRSPHPRLRENALVLAESLVPSQSAVRAQVLSMARDVDARVRLQVCLSLGAWNDDAVVDALATLAQQDGGERWFRIALASAVPQRAGLLLQTLLKIDRVPGKAELVRELATLVGARQEAEELARTLASLKSLGTQDPTRWQTLALEGLAEGMSRRGQKLGVVLARLPDRATTDLASQLLQQTAAQATNARLEVGERVAATRLLAHLPWKQAERPLTSLLKAETPQPVRLAAVRALGSHDHPDVVALLLDSWSAQTPAQRREVGEQMLSNPTRTLAWLQAMQAGDVNPRDVEPLRAKQLLAHSDARIHTLANQLLKKWLPADRTAVLADYRPALALAGEARKGREIFAKQCATCHRIAGVGIEVGPDISDTRTKTAEALLLDILNPNAAIDSNYVVYQILSKSGRVHTGMIVAETGSSVRLRRAEGQGEELLRQDIDEIVSTGASLMPEGFERTISLKEMADLLAFLKNWRYLDGAVPLPADRNRP